MVVWLKQAKININSKQSSIMFYKVSFDKKHSKLPFPGQYMLLELFKSPRHSFFWFSLFGIRVQDWKLTPQKGRRLYICFTSQQLNLQFLYLLQSNSNYCCFFSFLFCFCFFFPEDAFLDWTGKVYWHLKGIIVKACVCYFHQIFIYSLNDSPSKTMKNTFYFI